MRPASPGRDASPAGDLAGLRSRRDLLRQRAVGGTQPQPLLDAALAELDLAIELAGDGSEAERRLLREMFRNAPVPLFLLEPGGAIRRANLRASRLVGAPPGGMAGRVLTTFVDPPARAAVSTQLATAIRTGRQRHLRCQMLGASGPFSAILTIAPLRADQQPLLLVTVGRDVMRGGAGQSGAGQSGAGQGGAGQSGAGQNRGSRPARAAEPPVLVGTEPALEEPAPGEPVPPAEPVPAEAILDGEAARVVAAMTQRLDLVTAATRLLLDNATFSEASTLRRCARLLAGELAAWVIVDVERRQQLRRTVVIGPDDRESAGLARRAGTIRPRPGSLPAQVHETGQAALLRRAPDPTILGVSRDGTPLLTLLGATSVLSVPLNDGERTYGALTLARRDREPPFEAADRDLIEELGQQLALAIRVDRMFRRRSEIADSLQASLLPAALPVLPGIEFATAYVAASDADGVEVGGDFYDVYASPGGWGLAIGDVCGKGEEAAAVTAAARHAIRTLAHWNPDPADVLSRANEVLLATDPESRFLTVCAGHMRWHYGKLRITVASAGHPAQLIIRADGTVEPLDGGGMPLGIFPDAEPGTQLIDLAPGDMLFLFTDGVTEARSPEMEYFEDRMAAELLRAAPRSPAAVVAAVQSRIQEFSRGLLRDDMTMLVLQATRAPSAETTG